MKNTKLLVKGMTIFFLFLFIGIILFQVSGSIRKEDPTNHSLILDTDLRREIDPKDRSNLEKTINQYSTIPKACTDDTIIRFLENIGHRFPELDQMAKELGLTKQKTVQIIRHLENTYVYRFIMSLVNDFLAFG